MTKRENTSGWTTRWKDWETRQRENESQSRPLELDWKYFTLVTKLTISLSLNQPTDPFSWPVAALVLNEWQQVHLSPLSFFLWATFKFLFLTTHLGKSWSGRKKEKCTDGKGRKNWIHFCTLAGKGTWSEQNGEKRWFEEANLLGRSTRKVRSKVASLEAKRWLERRV